MPPVSLHEVASSSGFPLETGAMAIHGRRACIFLAVLLESKGPSGCSLKVPGKVSDWSDFIRCPALDQSLCGQGGRVVREDALHRQKTEALRLSCLSGAELDSELRALDSEVL